MTNVFYKCFDFYMRHKILILGSFILLCLCYPDMGLAANEDPCAELSDEDKYLCYCDAAAIQKKYDDAGCWACDVVLTLMMSMTHVADTVYSAIDALARIILGGGACIWIAVYFLKALGSFATQDPAKIIDGFLTFCFKIALVYVMIDSGINVMIEYIVNPLLSIGYDIGGAYSAASGVGG